MKEGHFIQTISGKKVWPFSLELEDIDIGDIAHSLSMQCRFNGQITKFYSVAEHCYFASKMIDEYLGPVAQLEALLHDGCEAYIGDMVMPLKRSFSEFRKLEEDITNKVWKKFNLSGDYRLFVDIVDVKMCATEAKQLIVGDLSDWKLSETPYNFSLPCWNPAKANIEFIKRYNELYFLVQDTLKDKEYSIDEMIEIIKKEYNMNEINLIKSDKSSFQAFQENNVIVSILNQGKFGKFIRNRFNLWTLKRFDTFDAKDLSREIIKSIINE